MKNGDTKQKILVIVGPTAVGKSALAVTLARKLGGDIISADSRQVYHGLNIGTGKITKKEMRGVPHHLLDVADPKKQFTVADYHRMARAKISAIFSRGKLPIIVGGTGHYIDAALGRIIIPEVLPNPALRKELDKKSTSELFTMLQKLDVFRARTIDPHNPRRLVRAIEIAYANSVHTPPPDVDSLQTSGSAIWLGITLPPAELKKKISMRLFVRISRGMIREVKNLHARGLSWKRMESIGLEYRYLSRYLRGLMTKEEMIEKLQTEIYRYAKRQMTWFKRNKEIKWFRPSQKSQIFAMLKSVLGD
ncbi:MAG: tRNA (adenosine(37)-N6)-dimethylallyltransferase MiaA [bacterium]|nr:tRNA (adenosine(37)-N6)-dimethylallyltransferase MiaA [bacterium]